VAYLICPTEKVDWRIPVEELNGFLRSRWPDVERSDSGHGQRAHQWTFEDLHDVWVPEDREVAWLDPNDERAAALAAHLAAAGPPNLILMDEGNNFAIELAGLDEVGILGELHAR